MRRFYSSALASALLLLGGGSVKADTNNWGVDMTSGSSIISIYELDASTGTSTLKSTKDLGQTFYCSDLSYVNNAGNVVIDGCSQGDKIWTYDTEDNTWTESSYWSNNFDQILNRALVRQDTSTGITSIGANSLKLQETAGAQKMWATNSSGEVTPINITNGTKLLINGRDVDQAIDNVGALSAALTGLPTVPQDSPLACGVGAGAHSGSNALSGGCASKVNERLTFNVAASFIPANQKYQGTDNAWSGRAGFVFKLGKINKPTLITMKEKKALQTKVETLSNDNQAITQSNQELRDLVAKQNERLEKLERIALANQSNQKTANSFLNISNLFSTMKSFLISSN